ncbi:MAG: response regulator [Lunatimonas sp.]|uniref:response regulator n=1 Tax=Lunatimonas sp. TaxID=2060141 RepID=UPI00263A6DB4|nr:response regulator [Lunatimonas sp.]MCC5938799.1 response regulator [Lunatimonas sp.]
MKRIHILLVEDNEGDILLTREALAEGNFDHELSVVKDGKEAMQFLVQEEPFDRTKKPDLVLLDINLPKKSGHEVLSFIKNKEEIKHIPVIMLTTSSSNSDILKAYKNHANCFITKPVDVEDFMETVAMIDKFWFKTAVLPSPMQT